MLFETEIATGKQVREETGQKQIRKGEERAEKKRMNVHFVKNANTPSHTGNCKLKSAFKSKEPVFLSTLSL